MTFDDLDNAPRMKDTMKPEDLNLDGCVNLAAEVLREAGEDLTQAARAAADRPSKENMRHLELCKDFYRSELFAALACGTIDGETAMRRIIKRALSGRAVRGVAE